MGLKSDVPEINEIAFFLHSHARPGYDALSRKGIEYSGALQLGVTGGRAEPKGDADDRAAIGIRVEILREALKPAIAQIDGRSREVRSKLELARKLKFISGVFSAVGSMGAAGTALLGKHLATIVLSLFSFLATSVGAGTTSIVLGAGRKETDLIERLRELAKVKAFAELAVAQLDAAAESELPIRSLTAMLKEANGQFRDLVEALAKSIV